MFIYSLLPRNWISIEFMIKGFWHTGLLERKLVHIRKSVILFAQLPLSDIFCSCPWPFHAVWTRCKCWYLALLSYSHAIVLWLTSLSRTELVTSSARALQHRVTSFAFTASKRVLMPCRLLSTASLPLWGKKRVFKSSRIPFQCPFRIISNKMSAT